MSTYFFDKNHRDVNRRITRRRLAANDQFVLPKGSSLRKIYLHNVTANAVTGGVQIGTAAAGAQVLAATPVGANALVEVTPTGTFLSKTDQTLYLSAVTAWNAAGVDVVVEYKSVPFQDTEYQPGSLILDATVGGKAHSTQ